MICLVVNLVGLYFICESVHWNSDRKSKVLGVQISDNSLANICILIPESLIYCHWLTRNYDAQRRGGICNMRFTFSALLIRKHEIILTMYQLCCSRKRDIKIFSPTLGPSSIWIKTKIIIWFFFEFESYITSVPIL